MDIKLANGNRVLITSNKPFGTYGSKTNWVIIRKRANGNFVMINKELINIKDLKQLQDHKYVYNMSTNKSKPITQFYFEQ